MSGIMVGHDGSNHSQTALREALALARGLGEEVTVVRAFGLREIGIPAGLAPFGQVPSIDEIGEHVATALKRQIAPALADFEDVPVTVRAVPGKSAAVLIRESEGFRMLVVASRGLGGLDKLLMGSVSERVVALAPVPVLVTRSRSTDG
ncbi:universal stress protein [Naumannella sp. ID2617S]|nr:universal stress protein [Naumannella sp. ID2617S]